MPTLPRTRPEVLWTKPLPAPPRRTFAWRTGAGADSAAGKAFEHEGTLWLCPGTTGGDGASQWPALLGLDLASGEDRVLSLMSSLVLEAQAAPAGEHIALATRTLEHVPGVSLIDRRRGAVAWEAAIAVDSDPDALQSTTNVSVAWESGTLLVGWAENVRFRRDEGGGQFRIAAFRDGQEVWRAANASLTGVFGGVVLTNETTVGGDFRERGLSLADGKPLWTRERRQPFGIFAGALVSKHLTPKGPHRFPSYTIAAADPRTGVDRWRFERDAISRFAWGDRHLAAGIEDGAPLVVLDDQGRLVLEDRTWANPAKGDSRAVSAVDGDNLLWVGNDEKGRPGTCCSPLVEPRARRWSIPEGLFSEHTVFFDGGFASLKSASVSVWYAKAGA